MGRIGLEGLFMGSFLSFLRWGDCTLFFFNTFFRRAREGCVNGFLYKASSWVFVHDLCLRVGMSD